MAGAQVDQIATAFVEARRARRALEAYPGELPRNLAEAYAIQDRAIEIAGRFIAGWKVGRIPEPIATLHDCDRLVGPIYDGTIVPAQDEAPRMGVFTGGFAAVEAEFMLKIEGASESSVPRTNEEAKRLVTEVRIGIEVASSPFFGINDHGPAVTISDHGNNEGVAMGAIVAPEFWGELDTIQVATLINNEVIAEASTASMLDGPFGAVRFLLNNLAVRNQPLEGPLWVSSGAITGVHPVCPGDKVRAHFGKLGEVEASIASL